MPAFTDEEWEELLEAEVPSMSHPVVQGYLKGRQALIDQENKDRSGSSHLPSFILTR
jgi:hypothetical protein